MPRLVDRESRRLEVIEIACELIARDGIEATTVRRVAEAAQCSTTLVSHYFKNKHELLLCAYRAAASNAETAVRRILENNPTDLPGCLEALLPLNSQRRRNWHIWFEFWGMAVGDAQFGAEHRRYLRHSVELIADVLLSRYGGQQSGTLEQRRTDAQRLFALISGIAAQAVFDSKVFNRKKQVDLVALEVARLDAAYTGI